MGGVQSDFPPKRDRDAEVAYTDFGAVIPDDLIGSVLVRTCSQDDITNAHVSAVLPFFLINCLGCSGKAKDYPGELYDNRESARVFLADAAIACGTLALCTRTFKGIAMAAPVDCTSFNGFRWWATMLRSLQNLYAPRDLGLRESFSDYTLAVLQIPAQFAEELADDEVDQAIRFGTKDAIEVLGGVDTNTNNEIKLSLIPTNALYTCGTIEHARIYLWLLRSYAQLVKSPFHVSIYPAGAHDISSLMSYEYDASDKPVIALVREDFHWFLHLVVPVAGTSNSWQLYYADSLNDKPRTRVYAHPTWITKRGIKFDEAKRLECFEQDNEADCLFMALYTAAHFVRAAGIDSKKPLDTTRIGKLVPFARIKDKARRKCVYTSSGQTPLCTIDATGNLTQEFATNACRRHVLQSILFRDIDSSTMCDEALR